MQHIKHSIKRLFLYIVILSLLIPGQYIMAIETEEGNAVHAEESEETDEILLEAEDSMDETMDIEAENEAENEAEDLKAEEPEAETVEEIAPEDAIEAEPAELPAETESEVQVTEVATAEEAAIALSDLEEGDPESRLIVFGDSLPEDTAASEIIYYEEYNEYILQFSSPEDAAQAQKDLSEDYDVYEDEVLTLDNLLDNGMGNQDSYSWGTTVMGADPYLNGIATTEEVTVAVIDSGVDPENPFFPEGVIRSDSWDLTMSDDVLTDKQGHGTHVCGIIADMTPDQVHILALRVYDDDEKTSWGLIMTALQYCLENDVDVINISLGANNVSSAPLDEILVQAKDAGIVVVCAAGNEGRPVMYPARLDSTIAVSAIRSSLELWSSSNYGEEVDFCAPGHQIISAARSTTEVLTTSKSGTSMAAPHVAAAFAYLKLAYPGASWDKLYDEAKARSIDLGADGRDVEFGWGYPELTGLFSGAIEMKECKVSLGNTSFTYDGKEKKPAVTVVYNGRTLKVGNEYNVSYSANKIIGIASVTITGKRRFTGSVTKKFKILPAKVTILTPVAGTKKMTVKYKTVKGSCRYQIAYRIKGTSSWTKVNTTLQTAKTIKELKSGKKYQVRVRAYKKVDGKTFIGPWSDMKTVKVK